MVLYRIFSQEHRIHYLANPVSSAVIFQIVCLTFTFLPPLFTGYFTSGFYYKELTYSEQPKITFDNQYHIILESLNSLLYSSSNLRFNNFFTSSYFSSNARLDIPKDLDSDGHIDQIEINIDALLSETIADKTLKLYLLFDYALNRFPAVSMTALGYISVKVPITASAQSQLNLYGRLRFVQRQAIRTYETDSSLRNSIIDFSSYGVAPAFDEVLRNYTNRKYFTVFEPQYIYWTRHPSVTSGNALQIRVMINNGQAVFRYVPSFWVEFRWSWIQYLAGLFPFFYVVHKVKEFVFSTRLVRTVVVKAP